MFTKPPLPIVNKSTPPSFDYRQYNALQGIYYQVFLKPHDYVVLETGKINPLQKGIYAARDKVIPVLKRWIPGGKEAGLAEAMLIGYKEDLDRHLTRSYSDTGVVHIIAISGMHLALIGWLLTMIFKPLGRRKYFSYARPVIIIACLWCFSLVAGASPSVLRAAIMFTCIGIGNLLERKSGIYNSLAASAFLLLCYNPFWLWDVGFQLSYVAVLSLAIFVKPIYDLLKIQNKVLDHAWKLCAVTLAAQILTIPLCIYHFHQFPGLFLIANLVVVPLSGIILLGEILLCGVCFIPPLANFIGLLLTSSIHWMNSFVESLDQIPFATLHDLHLNILQTGFLYLFIVFASFYLLYKQNRFMIHALTSLAVIFVLRCI